MSFGGHEVKDQVKETNYDRIIRILVTRRALETSPVRIQAIQNLIDGFKAAVKNKGVSKLQ